MLLLCGCVLAPPETKRERARLREAGRPYVAPADQRTLPEIGQPLTWEAALHRAFLANGDLEAAWFEWAAAMARIDPAASWPNGNLQIGFDYMFSRERMKAWDRTTLSAGFDPAMSLQLPAKARQAGKVAMEEARAAGFRFAAAKFDLQQRVLETYLDLALTEERARIERDNVALLTLAERTASQRVQAGGSQQDLLKARIDRDLATNALANLELEAAVRRSAFNALLGRDPQAPMQLPAQLPPPRPLEASDDRLIAAGVAANPELAALGRQVAGRHDALELARLQYLPDISPTASITGSMSQAIGAMVMLPTNLPAIRGRIEEARAMLRAAEAAGRQAGHDRAGRFVAALYALRNAERQAAFFEKGVLSMAQRALEINRRSYSAGASSFMDLIESQRTLLEVRRLIAEARIEREKKLAELETLAGADVETLDSHKGHKEHKE